MATVGNSNESIDSEDAGTLIPLLRRRGIRLLQSRPRDTVRYRGRERRATSGRERRERHRVGPDVIAVEPRTSTSPLSNHLPFRPPDHPSPSPYTPHRSGQIKRSFGVPPARNPVTEESGPQAAPARR